MKQGRIEMLKLKEIVEESLSDPRPSAPAQQVFKRLRYHHAQQMKATAGLKGSRLPPKGRS